MFYILQKFEKAYLMIDKAIVCEMNTDKVLGW